MNKTEAADLIDWHSCEETLSDGQKKSATFWGQMGMTSVLAEGFQTLVGGIRNFEFSPRFAELLEELDQVSAMQNGAVQNTTLAPNIILLTPLLCVGMMKPLAKNWFETQVCETYFLAGGVGVGSTTCDFFAPTMLFHVQNIASMET